MGSLVKLVTTGNIPNLNRICSVIFPQLNRNLAEINSSTEVKRPPSVFASFFRDKQAHLKEQNPELTQKEVMKLASDLWRNESSSTKQQFRNEYERKMQEFRQEAPKVPKRPVPPFVQFFKDRNTFLQYQYPNITERARKAGEMWNNLSYLDKSRYFADYSRKVKEFNENLSEEERELMEKKKSASEQLRKRKQVRKFGKQAMVERPKPPTSRPYNFFIQDHASEVPKEENVFKTLGARWNKMSDNEKMVYRNKYHVAIENYERELQEWKLKHDPHSK